MVKTQHEKDIEKLAQEIAQKKQELKDLQNKYTFKGLYSEVCGRNNILREIQERDDLTDSEKREEALNVLHEYVESQRVPEKE